MKSTMTLKSITLIALLGAALASPVWAQGGPGMGMGGGPGMQNAGTNAGTAGPGPGAMGPGGGRGMRFSQRNTSGWSLMTPEEQKAHRDKMMSVKTYDECKLAQTEHRTAMEARAKEKGTTLPTPRQNGCDRMKARGFIQ